MLKKIYTELVLIRKELQAIRDSMEFGTNITLDERVISQVARKASCDNETKFHE